MGADLVCSQELVALRLMRCTRIVNDFVDKDKYVVLRTTPDEKERLIVQLGTSDTESAVAAAKVVVNDCVAIDVNCGCPVKFSTQGGMGSSLLSQPKRIVEIVQALKRNVTIPITCKIRIEEDISRSITLCKMLAEAGVAAITVHARYPSDRPNKQAARWDELAKLVSADIGVPIIGNGDVYVHQDIERIRSATGCGGVMICRGAIWNPSVFRKEGHLPVLDMAREFLRKSIQYDMHIKAVKFILLGIMRSEKEYDEFIPMRTAETMDDYCKILGMDESPTKRQKI